MPSYLNLYWLIFRFVLAGLAISVIWILPWFAVFFGPFYFLPELLIEYKIGIFFILYIIVGAHYFYYYKQISEISEKISIWP